MFKTKIMKRLGLIIYLLFFVFNSSAQILNQIGNSIKTSTETNATDYNRTRSNKEHNLNYNTTKSPEEENEEKSSDENNNSLDSNLQFIFNSKIVFKADFYSDNEFVESKNMNYTYSDSIFMFDSNQGLIINDYRKNKMIIVDQDAKNAVSTPMLSPELMKLTISSGMMSLKYINTGKTKQIGGYLCSEYMLKDENGKQLSLWLTKENPFQNQNELIKLNTEIFFMNLGAISPDPSLVTLGIDQLNENGQFESSIYFESFSNEEYILNLNGYEFSSY